MQSPGFVELSLQARLGSHGEHCASVAVSLCASHDDLEALEIEVLYAKVEALVEAQACAVKDEPDEAIDPVEFPEHCADVWTAQYLGQACGLACANQVERFERQLENIPVEEK